MQKSPKHLQSYSMWTALLRWAIYPETAEQKCNMSFILWTESWLFLRKWINCTIRRFSCRLSRLTIKSTKFSILLKLPRRTWNMWRTWWRTLSLWKIPTLKWHWRKHCASVTIIKRRIPTTICIMYSWRTVMQTTGKRARIPYPILSTKIIRMCLLALVRNTIPECLLAWVTIFAVTIGSLTTLNTQVLFTAKSSKIFFTTSLMSVVSSWKMDWSTIGNRTNGRTNCRSQIWPDPAKRPTKLRRSTCTILKLRFTVACAILDYPKNNCWTRWYIIRRYLTWVTSRPNGVRWI